MSTTLRQTLLHCAHWLTVALLAVGCAGPTTQRTAPQGALVEAEAEKQREIALDYQIRQYLRLYRVGYPLLSAASDLCKDKQRPGIGWVLISKHDFKDEFRDTAIRRFDLDASLKVLSVVPGSPASVAGITPEDVIVQIGRHEVVPGAEAEKQLHAYVRDKIEPGAAIPVTVVRSGNRLTLPLKSDVQCDYTLVRHGSDSVNAFADGKHVAVTKGMLRFTETDQELSLVVAHEIAHNAMGHIEAKTQNSLGGLLLDILAAAGGINTGGTFQRAAGMVYSQEFEAEADYVGMYILARSGQSIDGAADFWRRMAAEHPGSIGSNHSASHPAAPQRFVAIEQTAREIGRKQSAGQPLLPELKQP